MYSYLKACAHRSGGAVLTAHFGYVPELQVYICEFSGPWTDS